MGVNWGLAHAAPSAAPEIASLTNLLDAIAERRQRMEVEKARQAQEAAQLEAQKEHHRALEKYNQDVLGNTRTHQAAELKAKGDKDAADRIRDDEKIAREGYGKVSDLVDAKNIPGAQATAKMYKMDLSPVGIAEAPRIPEAPRFTTKDKIARPPELGYDMVGEGSEVEESERHDLQPPTQERLAERQALRDRSAALDAENQQIEWDNADGHTALARHARLEREAGAEHARQAEATKGMYELRGPADFRTMLSAEAEGKARIARNQAAAADFEREYAPLAKQYGGRGGDAFAQGMAAIREGRDKEAAGSIFRDRVKDLEHQQNALDVASQRVAATKEVAKFRPPNAVDFKELARLDGDLKNIDRAIATIQKDPKAWMGYRNNQERWQRQEVASGAGGSTTLYGGVRRIGQGLGIADVAPEQGLKTDNEKLLQQVMTGAKNSIAKGYGGVITESDRQSAGSEMSELAQDPAQQIQTLLRVRERLQTGKDLFIQGGARMDMPPQATPAASGAGDDRRSKARELAAKRKGGKP